MSAIYNVSSISNNKPKSVGKKHGDTVAFSTLPTLTSLGDAARVKAVHVYHAQYVHGIEFEYTSRDGHIRKKGGKSKGKGNNGTHSTFELEADEYITRMHGGHGWYIDRIIIETNKGRTQRYGTSNGGRGYNFKAKSGMCIAAVRGGTGGHLHFLAPYYGSLTSPQSGSELNVPRLVVATAKGMQGKLVPLPIAVGSNNPADVDLGQVEISGVPSAYEVVVKSRSSSTGYRTANYVQEHAPGYHAWVVQPDKLKDVCLRPRPRVNPKPNGMFSLAILAKVVKGDLVARAMQMMDVLVVPDTNTMRLEMNPIIPKTRFSGTKEQGYVMQNQQLAGNGAVVFSINGPKNSQVALKFYSDDNPSKAKARIILNGWHQKRSVVWKDSTLGGSQVDHTFNQLANKNNPGSGWREIGGRLNHISVNSFGSVWGVGTNNKVYRRKGISLSNQRGTSWELIDSSNIRMASCGDGHQVWITGNNDKIFMRKGVSQSNRAGTSWHNVGGALEWISAGNFGQVWGVNSGDNIYRRTGINRDKPEGVGWEQISGKLSHISCHGNHVWGVNRGGAIYCRTGVSKSDPNGVAWQKVDGSNGAEIHVSSQGRVWLRTNPGKLYMRRGITKANPAGDEWIEIDDGFDSFGLSGRSVWAIEKNTKKIMVRGYTERPTFWAQMHNGVARLGRGAKVGSDVMVEHRDPSFKNAKRFALFSGNAKPIKWDVTLPGKIPLGVEVIDRTKGTGTQTLRVVGTNFDLPGQGIVKLGGRVIHNKKRNGQGAGGRGFNVVVFNKSNMSVKEKKKFDAYGSTSHCNSMADYLDGLNNSHLVCIYSYDAVRMTSKLSSALKRCGASSAVDRLTSWRHSYALVGTPGSGENAGREAINLNKKKKNAVVEVDVTNGAVSRSGSKGSTTPVIAPDNGEWKANTMILTGVPSDATLSHGYNTKINSDGTSTWTVPVSDSVDLHLLFDQSEIDEPDLKAYNLSAGVGASFDVGDAKLVVAGGVGTKNVSGSFSDECNVWSGSMSTTRAELGASLVNDDGSQAIVLKGHATVTGGGEFAGGFGSDVQFGCWRCGGEGRLIAPTGAITCPECDGNGYTISQGAKVHIFAGARVEAGVSYATSTDLGNGVTYNSEASVNMQAGSFVEGDQELYAGDGKYGMQAEGEAQIGVDVDLTSSIEVGNENYRGSATVGVSPPGSLGIGGSGVAKYDNGKITFGASGEIDFLIAGVSIGFEVTIDTRPIQEAAITVYEDALVPVSSAIVQGAEAAAHWFEGAGHTIARGADDAIKWTEGAAADTVEFFEDTGEAIADWTTGAAEDVADWTVGAANDVADWTVGAANDVANWTEGAVHDVGNAFSDAGNAIASLFTGGGGSWICTGLYGKNLISKQDHEAFEEYAKWVLARHTPEIMMYWKALRDPVRIAVATKDDDWWSAHLEWSDFCLEMIAEGSDESLEKVYRAFMHKTVAFVEEFNPQLHGLAPYHQDIYSRVKEQVVEEGDCPSRRLMA